MGDTFSIGSAMMSLPALPVAFSQEEAPSQWSKDGCVNNKASVSLGLRPIKATASFLFFLEDEKTQRCSPRVRRKRRSSSGFLSRVGCVFCPASLGAPLLAAAPPAAPPTASRPSLCGRRRRRSERRPRFMFVIWLLLIPPWEAGGGGSSRAGGGFIFNLRWSSGFSVVLAPRTVNPLYCHGNIHGSVLPFRWQMSPA